MRKDWISEELSENRDTKIIKYIKRNKTKRYRNNNVRRIFIRCDFLKKEDNIRN